MMKIEIEAIVEDEWTDWLERCRILSGFTLIKSRQYSLLRCNIPQQACNIWMSTLRVPGR